jgi:hypothetical protein
VCGLSCCNQLLHAKLLCLHMPQHESSTCTHVNTTPSCLALIAFYRTVYVHLQVDCRVCLLRLHACTTAIHPNTISTAPSLPFPAEECVCASASRHQQECACAGCMSAWLQAGTMRAVFPNSSARLTSAASPAAVAPCTCTVSRSMISSCKADSSRGSSQAEQLR